MYLQIDDSIYDSKLQWEESYNMTNRNRVTILKVANESSIKSPKARKILAVRAGLSKGSILRGQIRILVAKLKRLQ